MTNFFSLPGRLRQPAHRLARPLAALLLLATAAQAQTPSFGAMTTYPAGGTTNYYLATGDLNGDGVPDLVSSNRDNNNVSVLLGQAAGGFAPAVAYSAGISQVEEVVLADITGDTKLDVVVTGSGGVGVLVGTGTGTLGAGTMYPTGAGNGFSMKLYDVTRDGILDAVVANVGPQVSVLPGIAAGAFGTATNYTAGNSERGLSVGDFNRDGFGDLAISDAGATNVYVLLGQAGGFAPPVSYATGQGSYFLETADLNRDGQLDIIVSAGSGTSIKVLNGNANGTFNAAVAYPATATSTFLSGLTVGDVNGDGYPDVLVASASSIASQKLVYVLPGSSTGALGTAVAFGIGGFAYDITLADINRDGRPDLVVANGNDNNVGVLLNTTTVSAAPTLTSLNPTTGPVGSSVTLTGTNLTGATGVSFNGTAATTFTVVNATTITATVPAGATTGNVTVTTAGGTSNGVSFAVITDLVVSTGTAASPTPIVAGTYNTITVTSTGFGALAGNVVVNTSTTINNGGGLNDGCAVISGAGDFTLAPGGTLGICNAQGLSGTPGQGTLQNAGFRSLSTDATYVYNGTAAQVTGGQLPYQVRNVTVNNAAGLSLSQAVRVAQVARLQSGNLTTSGQPFTLLSSAAGTALVDNSGGGVVIGAGTMQRAVTNAVTGPAYRHFSSPVASTTFGDLATPGFSPVFNTGYNNSPTPNTVTPFPTVFGYDQSRLATVTSTYGAFDIGWFSPAGPGAIMQPTRGYTTNAPATATPIDFVGTFNNSSQNSGALNRDNGAQAGWQLLGNPYPSPLDWSTVALFQRPGMDAAVYVYRSIGQYVGTYRSYANGVGPSPLIDAGSGYFARVTTPGTPGAVNLTNTNRVTDFGVEPTFGRGTADPRPLVQLDLRGTTGPADALYAYAEAGATAGTDKEFDAVKLPNSTGLNLSSAAVSGESLAIDGRPAFTAATVLPLSVGVPAAGSYTITAAVLNNLPAGLDAYLHDAQTGQAVNLSTQPSYAFSVSATQATALLVGRFSLRFAARTALATVPAALTAAQVQLYPNPAHARFTVLMPGVVGATAVQAELLNALGQVVRRQAAALPASGATLTVETAELATGVYTLRLLAGPTTVTKRVVLQ